MLVCLNPVLPPGATLWRLRSRILSSRTGFICHTLKTTTLSWREHELLRTSCLRPDHYPESLLTWALEAFGTPGHSSAV